MSDDKIYFVCRGELRRMNTKQFMMGGELVRPHGVDVLVIHIEIPYPHHLGPDHLDKSLQAMVIAARAQAQIENIVKTEVTL